MLQDFYRVFNHLAGTGRYRVNYTFTIQFNS